jgi:hypothetical protein
MRILTLVLLLVFCNLLAAQDKFSLSGKIKDIENNETLLGVNIIVKELNIGTVSNTYGFYSIKLPKGTHEIQISYLGFQTLTDTIVVSGDMKYHSLNNSRQSRLLMILNNKISENQK